MAPVKLPGVMAFYCIDTHGELNPFLSHEWLLTNGMGAFASSSVVGCNMRRYHGLLCAAVKPPVGRIMALNRIGELVYLDGRADFLELSVNHFGQSIHPRGDRFLRQFELGQTAKWTFEVEGVRIVKELLLCWQKNLVGIRYHVEAPDNRTVELQLLPFVSLRDFHALQRKPDRHIFQVRADGWEMDIQRDEHRLHLRADAGQFAQREDWWFGHKYPIETDRGLDDTEDLFSPGLLTHKITGSGSITLWAGVGPLAELPIWDDELARHLAPTGRMTGPSSPATIPAEPQMQTDPSQAIQRLLRAAGDFVVDRSQPDGSLGTTIIAGYPWFADWGRDTMISLPGLLLVPGRFEEAGRVLRLFAQYVSKGMIPNRFDDYTNEPSYNTVDASLWFIHACFEYRRMSGDEAMFNSHLLPACHAVVDGYRHGTRYNIGMDEKDGLMVAGDASTQLTWMDAKCDGVVFTPRHGKAVEINALWYNALRLLGENELADKTQQGFLNAFWLNPFRGLYDVVTGDHRDDAIRPNQIFAASLPHSPLNPDQRRSVVEVVRRELLTPYGLRTLARQDPKYIRHYGGGPMERDRAYHNGLVWPWLIGHFLDAYLHTHDDTPDAIRQARVWLQPLVDHMNQGCIGQISECFEAEEPHRPVAAPAQAWSVAEVLRLAVKLGM